MLAIDNTHDLHGKMFLNLEEILSTEVQVQ